MAFGFGTEGQGSQRLNPNHFGDPLTFPLAPPSGQSIQLSISLHLLDALPQNLVQIFVAPGGCILLILVLKITMLT